MKFQPLMGAWVVFISFSFKIRIMKISSLQSSDCLGCPNPGAFKTCFDDGEAECVLFTG